MQELQQLDLDLDDLYNKMNAVTMTIESIRNDYNYKKSRF